MQRFRTLHVYHREPQCPPNWRHNRYLWRRWRAQQDQESGSDRKILEWDMPWTSPASLACAGGLLIQETQRDEQERWMEKAVLWRSHIKLCDRTNLHRYISLKGGDDATLSSPPPFGSVSYLHFNIKKDTRLLWAGGIMFLYLVKLVTYYNFS